MGGFVRNTGGTIIVIDFPVLTGVH